MAEYEIEENDSGRRVDRVVRSFLKKSSNEIPLSAIYSYIRKGLIRLNGKKVTPSQITTVKDILYISDSIECIRQLSCKKCITSSIKLPLSKNSKPHIQSINTAKLKILNRTDDLIFINKPLGITTHGKDSVDEIVKREFTPSFSLSFSVGALHRLDKDTTGILTFSQSLKGATEFSKAIKMGGISRYYIGINEGYLENAIWKLPYKDNEDITKEEITKVFLLEYAKKENLSLNCYRLFTGKKHQIRKGATHFGKPLFCDTRYGSKCKKNQTYFLHSFALVFQKKLFLDLPKIIIAPLPNRFLLAIKQYFKATWQNMEKINEISFLRQLLAKENTSN